ncbi:MAG: hypothetical protein IT480_07615 [Gammaproteobacteria bacterium]|nr:hypothetical protein [Gammaproteobacteria bacterium]
MKQLGYLRLGRGDHHTAEHRVLHLFRNRAELKKSFLASQDELQTLKDRIKQQEGVTARIQELLQELEGRLARPDGGYRALVFYQLRELWSSGHALLEQFSGELVAQQEERERRSFVADQNRRQFPLVQAALDQERAAVAQLQAARAAVQALQEVIGRLRRPWHYFRRLKLRRALQPANLRALLAEQGAEAARAARVAVETGPATDFPGLSLEARRAINIAVIVYAQLLCERLGETRLFELAHEASGRREPPDHYGTRAACERLMVEIQRGRLALQQRASLAQELRQRTEALKTQARYRSSGDTTPMADGPAAGLAVLVSEDAWEICRVLLR